jgi:hypothetical protein
MRPAILEDHVEQSCLAGCRPSVGRWPTGRTSRPRTPKTPGTERDSYRECCSSTGCVTPSGG